MQRVIFCPEDGALLDEAKKLSKINKLSIIIGDNDYTKNIVFDRNTVSVVSIPEKRDLVYIKTVNSGMHQIISYIDEFVEAKNIDIKISNLNLITIYKEKYKSRYGVICSKPGVYTGMVYLNSELERTFEFVVN